MCGIWGYFSQQQLSSKRMRDVLESFYNTKPRGPDNSTLKELNDFVNCMIGFHRLAIIDLDNKANQPFQIFNSKTKTTLITCNGEIYNYKHLIETEGLKPVSGSDCEVIKLLIEKYDIDKMLELIDGEFALAIVDENRGESIKVTLARDHIGIRPLYYAFDT